MTFPTRRALAHRFEPVQATALEGVARIFERVGETAMTFNGVGSWANRAVGLGLTRMPTAAELDAVDAFFASRGAVPRLELSAFVDPALLAELGRRGYALVTVADLLVRSLEAGGAVAETTGGIAIEEVDTSDDDAVLAHCDVASSGFRNPEAPMKPEELDTLMAATRTEGTQIFLARIEEESVGGGSCTTRDGIVTLFGTSVRPGHRNRGVHRALIEARLFAGRARGAELGAIISVSGGPTERNALRLGFELGYARLYLERRAPGLLGIGEAP